MKIILILMTVAFLSTSSMALVVEARIGAAVSAVEKEKKPRKPKQPKEPKHPKKPKAVPCACVCAGTMPNTKWSCSPTGCSTKDGTSCSAGGPSQSPVGKQTP